MNVKKLKAQGNELKLLVKGTDIKFMNALRRTAINAVQVLAIEDVSIYKNNSVLFDEFLASRLGLLPIKTHSSHKEGEKVKMSLAKKGPCTVYSADIKSSDPKAEIVFKEVPIVKLGANQEIKMEMTAVMGVGKEHAKWQPGIVSFNEVPDAKERAKLNNPRAIVESCPKKVLELKAGKIVLKDPYECTLCGRCETESNGKFEIVGNKNSFILRVESFGQLPAEQILLKAAAKIKEKSKEFEKELKKL